MKVKAAVAHKAGAPLVIESVDLDGPKAGSGANDFTLKAAYEGIFVAINDQPLSFRVAAEGASREDPFTGVRNVEVRAMMGLRFSFWAPPRVFEPLPQFEDP